MKKVFFQSPAMLVSIFLIAFVLTGCRKSGMDASTSSTNLEQSEINSPALKAPTPANPNFNLEVILRGEANAFGHVKFRQDNDIDKIVTLGVWIRDLQPNHEYQLQRAVDTNLDGNCTGTAWLTLGQGLVPQSIFTDASGTGTEDLFRNLSAAPSGATFDIHFQVIDAQTSAAVLTSDCYQFSVR